MPLNSHTSDAKQVDNSGILYVVATPIGNLRDITLRAIDILSEVDLIAAEDTRHTLRLLSAHGIKAHLVSYHEYNERSRIPYLIEKLKAGSTVAVVSDAGTPSVSDPGYRLITASIENHIPVVPIPGVSAPIAALSAAGLATDSFVFEGFPAKKKKKRLADLKELEKTSGTLVFYESPRRIMGLIEEIMATMGDRCGVLAREMTKRYEEFIRGRLSEIHANLKNRPRVRGEFTLLVEGRRGDENVSVAAVRAEIERRMESSGNGLPELSKTIARKYGISRNRVYAEALKLKRK
jgi:16S rRNA (cytidine1402-2'-O)-methyltransferase